MQFILPLHEDARTQRHATTLHVMLAFLLFGIGVATEGLYWFTSVSPNFKAFGAYKPFLFFGIACLAASIVLILLTVFQKTWLREGKNNLLFRIIEMVLLATSSVLFFMNGWNMPALLFGLMGAVVVFAILRERRTAESGRVSIDDAGIIVSTAARTRKLAWNEVESVLLRFSILTIECKDNRLIQQNIAGNTANAAALMDYSKEKIEAAKAVAVGNDW